MKKTFRFKVFSLLVLTFLWTNAGDADLGHSGLRNRTAREGQAAHEMREELLAGRYNERRNIQTAKFANLNPEIIKESKKKKIKKATL